MAEANNKIAVVTGAGTGVGRAASLALNTSVAPLCPPPGVYEPPTLANPAGSELPSSTRRTPETL